MKNKAFKMFLNVSEWLTNERIVAICFYIAFFFLVIACGIVVAD